MFNACHCQASHCSSSVYLSHKHYYCQTVMNIITVELFSMLIQYPWAQSCSRSPAGVPAALILILAWWFLLLDPSPRITSEGNNAARVAWRSVSICVVVMLIHVVYLISTELLLIEIHAWGDIVTVRRRVFARSQVREVILIRGSNRTKMRCRLPSPQPAVVRKVREYKILLLLFFFLFFFSLLPPYSTITPPSPLHPPSFFFFAASGSLAAKPPVDKWGVFAVMSAWAALTHGAREKKWQDAALSPRLSSTAKHCRPATVSSGLCADHLHHT